MTQTAATPTPRTQTPSLRFACPRCGAGATVPAAYAGRRGKCHACREVIQVPQAPAPAPAPLQLADLAPAPARAEVPCVECGLLFTGKGMTCKVCKQARVRAHKKAAPRRDLGAEAHVQAIAFWQVVGGGLGALLLLGLGLFLLVSGAAPLAGMLLVPALPCVAVLALGLSLRRYGRAARAITIALAALAMFLSSYGVATQGFALPILVPAAIQLLWNGAMIWTLLTSFHVFEPQYRAAASRSQRTVPFWTSPFFWIPVAVFVVTLVFSFGTLGATIALLAR